VIDPVDDAFLELQREYLAELPARLDELRAGAKAFRAGEPDADAALKTRFHRLAGSGGSYGFPEITEVARAAELWLATAPPIADAARIDEAIDRLTAIARRSRLDMTPVDETPEGRSRAILILPPGKERDEAIAALRAIGYEVRIGDRHEDPQNQPADGRPDLVVIGTAAGEGDPSAIASSWTGRQVARPRAVVLIETLRAVDRLRAVAAGVDAVMPIERMVEHLPRYARTLARVGAPPSTVLLAEPDPVRAAEVSGELEECDIRVVRCALAQPILELLDREVPDVLVLAGGFPDAPADVVIRMVRQDLRFRLLPILLLGPSDPTVLTQTVISRAERGRRVRELLHRDELTGLLNVSTLLGELENAVDSCRRHGGPLAFVVFDLQRFHEVNDRWGTMAGDQILLHVANVFRSNVRASDVIGRLGGDEFGMILRGGGSEGAAVLAEKLRAVLGRHPAAAPDGEQVAVHASVGWASYPGDGENAAALSHAAHRRLKAKG
jgi:diguanylate cyclase (GGDEF)-like protein